MSKQDNLHDFLVDVAEAIRNKKGSTEKINPQNFSEEIKNLPSGGGATEVEKKDVNFYDYDGTRLYSYSWEEAMAMTELPPLPTQKGLICQGWNYTLDGVKAQNGSCDVGATYITDDGKTRLYLTIDNERAKDIWLYLSGNIEVNWGDGTIENHNGSTLQLNHKYAEYGEHVVSIEVKSGTLGFRGSTTYNAMGERLAPSSERYGALSRVEVGNGVTSIGSYAFQGCTSLQSIIIPDSVTSIGRNAIQYCTSLQSVVIPDGVTSINNNTFTYCASLQSVVIPDGVTSIGNYALNSCSSLQSVVIPDGVTSIGDYAFQYCSSLQSVVIPDGVTSINNYTFTYCASLKSVVISDGVTSIGDYAFQGCTSLQSIIIPDSVTSIGRNAIQGCGSLQSIVIPDSVTSIGNSTLNGLSSCAYIDFSSHISVPTLSASNSISSMNAGTKVIVPDALYDEWIVATNWTGYVSYIVKDSEYTRPL